MTAGIRREYPQQPLIGVGAVVVDRGRVLLVKRGKAPLVGEWSIPGGMLELGETVRAATEREALEETGLAVRTTQLLGVFDRIVADEGGGTMYHYVLIDFLCEKLCGEPRAAGDAAEVGWFTPTEVEKLPLPADTKYVIELGIARSEL